MACFEREREKTHFPTERSATGNEVAVSQETMTSCTAAAQIEQMALNMRPRRCGARVVQVRAASYLGRCSVR